MIPNFAFFAYSRVGLSTAFSNHEDKNTVDKVSRGDD